MIFSGADHARVAQANPAWSVEDWCRYWELDARKIERKEEVRWERIQDCGSECRCVSLK